MNTALATNILIIIMILGFVLDILVVRKMTKRVTRLERELEALKATQHNTAGQSDAERDVET